MVVSSDAEIIERLLRFDDCISARRIMSYDMRVYKLVEHVSLPKCRKRIPSENRRLLARHIQDEIEDWILLMLLPDAQQACGL